MFVRITNGIVDPQEIRSIDVRTYEGLDDYYLLMTYKDGTEIVVIQTSTEQECEDELEKIQYKFEESGLNII